MERPSGPSAAETTALADALWDGVRHFPPIPTATGGLRGWYLSGPYASVVAHRRRRVWRHRSPEPWLTAQWLMDRLGGGATPRSSLRYEGLPGRHSYESSYRAVAEGRFTAPFVFVAGFGRSGTTSVQNLVLAAFSEHVLPGVWDGPGHPLRLWWYPKHNAAVARRIAGVDPAVARVVVCVRPFVDSAASLALYCGLTDPDAVTSRWVRERAAEWRRMADVACEPGVLSFPFAWLPSISPVEGASFLAEHLGIDMDARLGADTTWDDVYQGRISREELDNPYLGNLPHADRPVLTERLRDRIADVIGSDTDYLDETYLAAVSA